MTDLTDGRSDDLTDDGEQLPTRILALAREVNAPPATPREEIWLRVQAARRTGASMEKVVPLRAGREVSPSVRKWAAWITGIAAVLAVGIGLGRIMPRESVPSPPAAVSSAEGDSRVSGSKAYTVAAIQHLSRVETLLTSLSAAGQLDSTFALQASDLLGATRLLQESPQLDPRLRRLLGDLEDILVQIALYNAARSDEELDLITEGLEERQVLPRLRTAVPIGL